MPSFAISLFLFIVDSGWHFNYVVIKTHRSCLSSVVDLDPVCCRFERTSLPNTRALLRNSSILYGVA